MECGSALELSQTANNVEENGNANYREGSMKETLMLMGFGIGLVTGALLYKYSACTKQAVEKGEQAVMKEVKKATSAVKQAQKKSK